jgi:hypothetical protein
MSASSQPNSSHSFANSLPSGVSHEKERLFKEIPTKRSFEMVSNSHLQGLDNSPELMKRQKFIGIIPGNPALSALNCSASLNPPPVVLRHDGLGIFCLPLLTLCFFVV